MANLCFCIYYFMTMLDSESSLSFGYGLLSALSVSLILGAILLMRWRPMWPLFNDSCIIIGACCKSFLIGDRSGL